MHTVEHVDRLLRDSGTKVVGWGTGACYRSPAWPSLRHDYLVDGNPARWGQRVDGLAVRDPQSLADEDPARTVIVIYSLAADQIADRISALGAFPHVAIHALAVFWRTRDALGGLSDANRQRAERDHRQVFVMQGPVTRSYTPMLMRAVRALNPKASLVLSTWDDTPADALRAVDVYADIVIAGPHPSNPAPANVNRQILSMQRGLAAARRLGADTVCKVRTDLVPLAPGVIDACTALVRQQTDATVRRHGMKMRIVVPETYTRLHVPYHPSDLVQCGHIDDLERYWAAPFDCRTYVYYDAAMLAESVRQAAIDRLSPECYFAATFADTVGWRRQHTRHDSWAFLRDLFVVAADEWLDLFWAKRPTLDPLTGATPLGACMTHAAWRGLVAGTAPLSEWASRFDIDATPWGRLFDEDYRAPEPARDAA